MPYPLGPGMKPAGPDVYESTNVQLFIQPDAYETGISQGLSCDLVAEGAAGRQCNTRWNKQANV